MHPNEFELTHALHGLFFLKNDVSLCSRILENEMFSNEAFLEKKRKNHSEICGDTGYKKTIFKQKCL